MVNAFNVSKLLIYLNGNVFVQIKNHIVTILVVQNINFKIKSNVKYVKKDSI